MENREVKNIKIYNIEKFIENELVKLLSDEIYCDLIDIKLNGINYLFDTRESIITDVSIYFNGKMEDNEIFRKIASKISYRGKDYWYNDGIYNYYVENIENNFFSGKLYGNDEFKEYYYFLDFKNKKIEFIKNYLLGFIKMEPEDCEMEEIKKIFEKK